jgi:hypothetical protein
MENVNNVEDSEVAPTESAQLHATADDPGRTRLTMSIDSSVGRPSRVVG